MMLLEYFFKGHITETDRYMARDDLWKSPEETGKRAASRQGKQKVTGLG